MVARAKRSSGRSIYASHNYIFAMAFLSRSVWLLLLISAILSTTSPVPNIAHNTTSTHQPTTTPTTHSLDPFTTHNYPPSYSPSSNTTTALPSASKSNSEHPTDSPNTGSGVAHLIAEDTYSTGDWIFLVGKIIAGLAALCVLVIIIFLIHRWRVRGRRRRIGNMMGLGIRRNKLLEARHGKAGGIRRIAKEERVRDVSAHSWRWGDRREDDESDLESVKGSPERGRGRGRNG